MFYILSRLFALTASPLTYIFALFIMAVIFKRKCLKIIFTSVSILLIFIFSNNYIYHKALLCWVDGYVYDLPQDSHYDYCILPGGFTGYDSDRQRVEYYDACDRLIDAVDFYHRGVVDKLVFTGDGASCTSGNVDAFLIHMYQTYNIPPEDAIIEPNAKNTFENFLYTKDLLKLEESKFRILVVNSALYMRRSVQCCERLGLKADFYSTDIVMSQNSQWESILPDFHRIDDWYKLIHEWIGCIAYKFMN